jgi:hypothetical protein
VTLRLAPRKKKKVSWQGDTVDNENLNKKSSKSKSPILTNSNLPSPLPSEEADLWFFSLCASLLTLYHLLCYSLHLLLSLA